MNVEVMAERIRAEFEEMPGMMLTMPQASRLFGLEHEVCRTVVDRLITTAYLKWTHSGAVTRAAR